MTADRLIRRARPLLGTRVSIHLAGLPEAVADDAIEAAFAEIARLHGLMSFHETGSDLSRLNREAARGWVAVAPDTADVIATSLELSRASGGVFDVTVGGALVAAGLLPAPPGAPAPDPAARWSDIEWDGATAFRFRRPLWIDLGGIAKGHAVDRALATIAPGPEIRCCINAGGDLRVTGPEPEPVLLRATTGASDPVPVVELLNAALAGSTGRPRLHGRPAPPHRDPVRGRPVGTRSFAAVVADSCRVADALTKIVLARKDAAEPLLRRYKATAYLHTGSAGWRALGVEQVAE